MCSSSAAAPPAPPSRRCSPRRAATWCCSRRNTIRASTSANRCCRPTSSCSNDSACATRSRRSACRSSASSSCSPDTRLLQLRRLRRRLGHDQGFGLAGAPLATSTSCCSATPPRAARRPSKAATVREVTFDDEGATVQAELDDGARRTWRARFVVDASGPRHGAGQQVQVQGEEHATTTARRCSATSRNARRLRGQARRQHQHLLVRARLVLVHPAGRRHDQRRRRVLGLLPEGARQAAARTTSSTPSRCARNCATA